MIKHLAIILDGNRRFAKKLMLEPWKGHEFGKQKVKRIIESAKNQGITQMTFYALSSENIKNRPEKELNYLYDVFRNAFEDLKKDTKVKEDKVKIKFIGDLELIPADLKKQCLNLEEQTFENNNFLLNFAIAYGGRQELVNAIKKIINKKINLDEINEEVIKENLHLQDEPDLIIRTGGEKRTSNFLPWQSAYSEWIFLNKMWPEFEESDLVECIKEFNNRKRNFGK